MNVFIKKTDAYLHEIGKKTLRIKEDLCSWLDFFGKIVISFGRLFKGKSYLKFNNFVYIVQKCGVETLGLVSLISLLVGMIIAFVGAIQLQMIGAQVYIADMVGVAMVRVLSPVMTGIIVSGRIGASFAAELGMMKTNEEIDAFKTLGVSPIDFLVIPRILALIIMIPLLTLYADFMGILGGFIVSVTMMHLNPVEYLHHTQTAINLKILWIGLIQSFVFGAIVSITGCQKGMTCERNAAGVGAAATNAVVDGITGIVIATAIITFICKILGV